MDEAGIWSDQVKGYLISVIFILNVPRWMRHQVATGIIRITDKLLMVASTHPDVLALPRVIYLLSKRLSCIFLTRALWTCITEFLQAGFSIARGTDQRV